MDVTLPVIKLTTIINAPVERVFDLSRSIELHVSSTAHTGETAVGGVTTGLIGMGQEVTWRARHFGMWQYLTSRITEFDRPAHFRDSQVQGIFRRLDHDHLFTQHGDKTTMQDVFDYEAPLGILGKLADQLFLINYMTQLLSVRNALIKTVAEGIGDQDYFTDGR